MLLSACFKSSPSQSILRSHFATPMIQLIDIRQENTVRINLLGTFLGIAEHRQLVGHFRQSTDSRFTIGTNRSAYFTRFLSTVRKFSAR